VFSIKTQRILRHLVKNGLSRLGFTLLPGHSESIPNTDVTNATSFSNDKLQGVLVPLIVKHNTHKIVKKTSRSDVILFNKAYFDKMVRKPLELLVYSIVPLVTRVYVYHLHDFTSVQLVCKEGISDLKTFTCK
jgi:hypothetical protein